MKRSILLFLFLNFSVPLFYGQDTTDMSLHTKWYYSPYSENCIDDVMMAEAVRDTLIGDRLCRIIGVTREGKYISKSELPFYVKNKKMFFHEDDKWNLLYDFNLNEGDTLYYYLSKKSGYYCTATYDENIGLELKERNPYNAIIEKKEIAVSKNGVSLNRFQYKNFETGVPFPTDGYIVDNIGSFYGLFGLHLNLAIECWTAEFRCYRDDNLFYKNVDKNCDEIVATDDEDKSSGINIYPNPGSNILNIDIANDKYTNATFTIINAQGSIVKTSKINQAKIDVNTADFSSGVYMILFWNVDGRVLEKKWVKE